MTFSKGGRLINQALFVSQLIPSFPSTLFPHGCASAWRCLRRSSLSFFLLSMLASAFSCSTRRASASAARRAARSRRFRSSVSIFSSGSSFLGVGAWRDASFTSSRALSSLSEPVSCHAPQSPNKTPHSNCDFRATYRLANDLGRVAAPRLSRQRRARPVHLLRRHRKLGGRAFCLDGRAVLLGHRRHSAALARQRSLEPLREASKEGEEKEKEKMDSRRSNLELRLVLCHSVSATEGSDARQPKQNTHSRGFLITLSKPRNASLGARCCAVCMLGRSSGNGAQAALVFVFFVCWALLSAFLLLSDLAVSDVGDHYASAAHFRLFQAVSCAGNALRCSANAGEAQGVAHGRRTRLRGPSAQGEQRRHDGLSQLGLYPSRAGSSARVSRVLLGQGTYEPPSISISIHPQSSHRFFPSLQFLSKNTPQSFLDELAGMAAWHAAHPTPGQLTTDLVSRVFYTVANMPADPVISFFLFFFSLSFLLTAPRFAIP